MQDCQNGQTMTFVQLFEKQAMVEIPIIQRDFVQGRPSAKEVRALFLDALSKKLSTSEATLTQSLDLDFVYGNQEQYKEKKVNKSKFSPLDGQQRLTTLFLLHWYTSIKEDKFSDFQQILMDESGNSRFTYQTRTSSKEFFDSLVSEPIDLKKIGELKLSDYIKDRNWFFLSWDLDPTIQSVLVMVDAIHERFIDSKGIWERLTETKKPYITFQFLNLDDFGLADDLYIKMNSRGKPLTEFENFKARFEQHIGEICGESLNYELHDKKVTLREYFSHKVDTDWADLFWSNKSKGSHLFDKQLMNFIRTLTTVFYAEFHPELRDHKVNENLAILRSKDTKFSFFTYDDLNSFPGNFVEVLVRVLDMFHGANGELMLNLNDSAYYSEKNMFKDVINDSITKISYAESIQFYAYCLYLLKHSGNHLHEADFAEWMRVVVNLSVNTLYNRVDEFRKALLSIRKMMESDRTISECLIDPEYKVDGFARQQVREERIKVLLIARSDNWRELIFSAEQHKYFKGQIEFLLKFSGILDYYLENSNCDWNNELDLKFMKVFNEYYRKANAVFGEKGLREFEDYLWERALLSQGDYMLYVSSWRWSLLDDTHRDYSWKRLLRGMGMESAKGLFEEKRECVKKVLDQLNLENLSSSLLNMIAKAECKDSWRQKLVDCPATISYCGARLIRKESGSNIYLLSKSQMNGNHVELVTYHLWKHILIPMRKKGLLSPFEKARYFRVNNSWEEPEICLEGFIYKDNPIDLSIKFNNKRKDYILTFKNDSENKFVDSFIDLATNVLGFYHNEGDVLFKNVTEDSLLNELNSIFEKLRELEISHE